MSHLNELCEKKNKLQAELKSVWKQMEPLQDKADDLERELDDLYLDIKHAQATQDDYDDDAAERAQQAYIDRCEAQSEAIGFDEAEVDERAQERAAQYGRVA